jgi:glycine/D-amino acid oxidase-like deaminating enzyme
MALWDRLAGEIGEDIGFRRCGLLYLSDDEAEIETWARWRDLARPFGLTTEVLGTTEAALHGKATNRPWKGGVFSPSDGIADPARAGPIVARAIRRPAAACIRCVRRAGWKPRAAASAA